MANLWQRITGRVEETRAVQPTVPSRAATYATPELALSLTAVYRAVQIIATPISKMNLRTYRFATGMEMQIENPIIVNKPSLLDSRRDFLFQTVVALGLEGNAFWLKVNGNNGNVNNLILLPGNSVSIQYVDSTDISKGVVYYYEGRKYTQDQMEHLKLFSRAGFLRGLSPIETCNRDIASAIDLRDYAANWFSAAGVPTGILTTNQMLNPADAESITATWHNKQQNRQVAVLGNGFDYKAIALSPRDALFTDIQEQAVRSIARLYGVPSRLLLTSVPGSSDTYTNVQDENQVFYRHTLMAYTDAITDALSNCLPRGTRVEFDFEHLFKADVAARYNYYKTGIDAGFLTPEMVQEKEGLNG
jgi:HK97 family phage portal protein